VAVNVSSLQSDNFRAGSRLLLHQDLILARADLLKNPAASGKLSV